MYFDRKVIFRGITPNGNHHWAGFSMDLKFNERSYTQEFQLVPSSTPLSYDGIWGRDFLRGTKTVLDYGKYSIAVFGYIMYPVNPRFSRKPENEMIKRREVELAKLVKTNHLEPEQSEGLEN